MPRKMARSDPRPSVRVTRGAGSIQHLASVLQEGRENANIDAGLGFIWRISAKKSYRLYSPLDAWRSVSPASLRRSMTAVPKTLRDGRWSEGLRDTLLPILGTDALVTARPRGASRSRTPVPMGSPGWR